MSKMRSFVVLLHPLRRRSRHHPLKERSDWHPLSEATPPPPYDGAGVAALAGLSGLLS
jgi:hypothetical protein